MERVSSYSIQPLRGDPGPAVAPRSTELAREQIDAFSKGDWELLRGILSSDVRYEEFGTERKVEGPEKIVELFKGWKTAFPDAAGKVTKLVCELRKHAVALRKRLVYATSPLEYRAVLLLDLMHRGRKG